MHLCVLAAFTVPFLAIQPQAGVSPFLDAVTPWPQDVMEDFQKLNVDQQTYLTNALNEEPLSSHFRDAKRLVSIDSMKVMQVTSTGALLVKCNGEDAMIIGIDTTNIADEAQLSGAGLVFRIDGTESFVTVLGATRTVTKLKAISTRAPDDVLNRVLTPCGYRRFQLTNKHGTSSVIATVTDLTTKFATLKKVNSDKSARIPAAQFSEADRQWLSDKNNIAEMKRCRREFDAKNRQLKRQ